MEGEECQATQSLLGSPQMPPTESLTTTLANDVAAIPTPFVLVLDDYQLIRNTFIHDALAFLLDHQPPRIVMSQLIIMPRINRHENTREETI
ncbi:MAG: hypothetical protein JW850_15560 [Thermoflexales bacterium]|nr:hypothetical protein [Thermoflexales bacterium]